MATLDIIEGQKKKSGSITLDDALVSDKVNKAVLYQAVRANLSAKHHGTVNTKTRADVCRTTKKVYRQKGTGGARHGSKKSSPFVGGGRVFGPHPRDYTIRLPKKVRQLALREAIRSKIQEKDLLVVKDFPFKEIKTKVAADFFKGLEVSSALVVLNTASDMVEKSVRNLKGFKVLSVNELSVVEILKYPRLVFTADSFGEVQKRYLV